MAHGRIQEKMQRRGSKSGNELQRKWWQSHANGENSGRTNTTVTNDANEADGMKTYNAKTGFIEVRFVTGNSKGFNVERALKQVLAAAREQDDEFTILPLSGISKNLCISADVRNTKDGIEQ
jgi:hypothetical protein